MSEPDTSAMTYYHSRTREWFYLPTDPPAKKWRGPFPLEAAMRRAMREDMGAEPFANQTRATPDFLKEETQ